jgi:hypothetical protein
MGNPVVIGALNRGRSQAFAQPRQKGVSNVLVRYPVTALTKN